MSTTKKPDGRRYAELSDSMIEGLRQFADEQSDYKFPLIVWDRKIRGLRVRIGVHKTSWQFFAQHRLHTKRGTTFEVLGVWPTMSVHEARKAASVVAGRVAERRITPGKRRALRVSSMLDDYERFLEGEAANTGKPARHLRNVRNLRKRFFGEWERWPAADISRNPSLIRDWHRTITKEAGPISANRAAAYLRSAYRYALQGNRTLPPELPTSNTKFNKEASPGKGLAPKDFKLWATAWAQIKSPVRRSYFLTAILTGCRPGELARLRREDILPRERVFVIRNAKAGSDIRIVLSIPIIHALRIALEAHDGELVFPGCSRNAARDGLPAYGVQLRRTYRTQALAVGCPELETHYLMAHAPAGISGRYLLQLQIAAGPSLRRWQRIISNRIVNLLGLNLALGVGWH